MITEVQYNEIKNIVINNNIEHQNHLFLSNKILNTNHTGCNNLQELLINQKYISVITN